jgi:hypothetical protein
MLLKHRSSVLNDIEETRNAIFGVDKKRRENIESSRILKSHFQVGIEQPYDMWQDINSAVAGLEYIRKYILNYDAKKSDWTAFMKYIEKTDKIWKQDFNQHIKNYKFVNGEVIRNV